MYRRAVTVLQSQVDGEDDEEAFLQCLSRAFYAFHWVLPYPCPEVFTQTTKQGERMWYSIKPINLRGRPIDRLKSKDWQWARKDHHAGFPPALPPYLSWTKEKWLDWIDGHRQPG